MSKPHYVADIEGGRAAAAAAAHGRDDADSQHSRTKIIKETRTFAVEAFTDGNDVSPDRSNGLY